MNPRLIKYVCIFFASAVILALIMFFISSCSNTQGGITGSSEMLYISDGYSPMCTYMLRGGFIAKKSGISIFGFSMDITGDYETFLLTDGTITDFKYYNYSEEYFKLIDKYVGCLNQISDDCMRKWKKYSEDCILFNSDILLYGGNTYVIFEYTVNGRRECLLFSLDDNNIITANREFALYDNKLPNHLLAVYDDTYLCVNDTEWFDFELSNQRYAGESIDKYYLGKEQVKELLIKSSEKVDFLSEDTEIRVKISQLVMNTYYVFFQTVDVDAAGISTIINYYAEFDSEGNMMRLGKVNGFVPDNVKIVFYNTGSGAISNVSF